MLSARYAARYEAYFDPDVVCQRCGATLGAQQVLSAHEPATLYLGNAAHRVTLGLMCVL